MKNFFYTADGKIGKQKAEFAGRLKAKSIPSAMRKARIQAEQLYVGFTVNNVSVQVVKGLDKPAKADTIRL